MENSISNSDQRTCMTRPKSGKERKELSFSPTVETFDIPRPSVTIDPEYDEDEDEETDFYPPSRELLSPGERPTNRRQGSMLKNPSKGPVMATTPQNTPRSSNSPVSKDKGPEWYEELDDIQVSMFKEVFELLDHDGGGTINADELYRALKDLDIEIERDEIENVLSELDKDGNGEIDFDEFLYAMSMTDRYIDQITGASKPNENDVINYSKRQRLFFTAITKFAIKNSLNDIERYYAQKARQAPHVISFYTAGARLEGLNDRQLERELKRLQKNSKNQDSPYAKLPFMPTHPKPKKRVKQRKQYNQVEAEPAPKALNAAPKPKPKDPAVKKKVSLNVEDSMSDSESDIALHAFRTSNRARTRRSVMPCSEEISEIKNLLNELAQGGSIVARLPGIHLVPAIRTKLDNGDKDLLCSSLRKKRQTCNNQIKGSNAKTSRRQSGLSKTTKRRKSTVPTMARQHYEMPAFRIPMDEKKLKSLTIEDVPFIRQKVSKALGKYYTTLQKNHIKTAWDHWDNLNVESIPSEKFKENFRKVYGAYSPHKEEDVFVIAPWIPGPRYTSATASRPSSRPIYQPAPRPQSQPTGGGYRGMGSMSSRCGPRPATVMT